MAPKVSVIVPVYNAEKWLNRCIDSILSQTYTDFELLLIDDGSKDNSGAICDEYAEKDIRVSVHHKPNGGVSSARNLGLDNVKGEWIAFVDADDWLDSDFIESYLTFTNQEINLIIGGHNNHYSDGHVELIKFPKTAVDKKNFDSCYWQYNLHWRTSPWGKFYRKSVIDRLHLRFDAKMKIGEDALFLYDFMIPEKEFLLIPYSGYNYNYEVTTSLTKRIYDYDQELYFLDSIKSILTKLRKNYRLCSEESVRRVDWSIGYYTSRLLNSLYRTSSLSRRKRIEIMRNLDLMPLINTVHASRLKEKILYRLLKYRMFYTYDSLRSLHKHGIL